MVSKNGASIARHSENNFEDPRNIWLNNANIYLHATQTYAIKPNV